MIVTNRRRMTSWASKALCMALATSAQAGSAEIEQITGNLQTTQQTGDNNQARVEQSAVAAGLVPGAGNIAGITQDGADNRAGISQQGSGLDASIGQTGNANAASVDQSGEGLKASVEQFGNGREVQVFQSGVGNGAPVAVQQY